jgi:hypothetical protein
VIAADIIKRRKIMSKSFVDQLIHNMKLAGLVAKAAPWMVEGIREQEMNVRYVGLQLKDDWLDIFPAGNNVMMKFIIDRNNARIDFVLANKPPFYKITTKHFTELDKWETLLGGLKLKLKKDKTDVMSHTEELGNLYAALKPHLK